eukprot:4403730-Prorocentrum_lima.AAC.1
MADIALSLGSVPELDGNSLMALVPAISAPVSSPWSRSILAVHEEMFMSSLVSTLWMMPGGITSGPIND